MTLTFLDIRVGQIAVEASSAAIDGKASGPFAGMGNYLDYDDLFTAARTDGSDSALPWPAAKPRSNKFWKKYVTASLTAQESDWSRVAWDAMTPFKISASLPTIGLHPNDRRAYSEAYIWPTGLGFTWNNWIKGGLDVAGLAAIVDRIRNGEVDHASPDGTSGSERIKTLSHATLDALREAFWGEVPEGTRSDPITIVSVIQAVSDAADPQADAAEALKSLLDSVESSWGERPRMLAGDRNADSGHSVYVAKGLRIIWLPSSFFAEGRIHRVGCFHRNLLLSTLQVEMLAATAEMLAAARPKSGSLPPDYAPFVDRVLSRIEFFLSGGGYSAPFLSAQLERGPVKAARAALTGI